MDLLKLSDSEPNVDELPHHDTADRFESAERKRSYVLKARDAFLAAQTSLQNRKVSAQKSQQIAESAKIYLSQLESGWGAPIATVGPATLYEFGLVLPGYSGPLQGFAASTNQYGQVQHVSNVQGTTKSGAGCAALGCLAAGPVGAILGAQLGHKNEVRTDIHTIDNRQFEIQVMGPGVAWSYVGNATIEHSVRQFRDLLLARSTSRDDPKVLALAQNERVIENDRAVEFEVGRLKEVEVNFQKAESRLASAWNSYETARLPIKDDLIERWKRSGSLSKIVVTGLGPILGLAWITAAIYGVAAKNPNLLAVGLIVGSLHLIAIGLWSFYFKVEVRLMKAMPSESPTLRPLFDYLDKLHQRRRERNPE